MNIKKEKVNHPLDEVDATKDRTNEKEAARLFGILSLAGANGHLSLKEAIAQARDIGERFKEWEANCSLVKEIAVRLGDGREMMDQAVRDAYSVSGIYGLHFTKSFPRNAVLHVYKKADEHFGEVHLLTLKLKGVPSTGYRYERTYKNGQSLSLSVKRCSDGEFSISLDCSYPQQRKVAAGGQRNGLMPWLVGVGFAGLVGGVTYFARNRLLAAMSAIKLRRVIYGALVTLVALIALVTASRQLAAPNAVESATSDRVLKIFVEKLEGSDLYEVSITKNKTSEIQYEVHLDRTKGDGIVFTKVLNKQGDQVWEINSSDVEDSRRQLSSQIVFALAFPHKENQEGKRPQ